MAHLRITSGAEVAAPASADLTGPQAPAAGEALAAGTLSCAEQEPPSDGAPPQLPHVTARWQALNPRTRRERRPLALALLLSLLIHALLLSLTFGGDAFGLPGLGFPWRDRRIEVPDLRIVLVPAHTAPAEPAVMSLAQPSQRTSIDPPVAVGPAPTTGLPAPADPGRPVATVPAARPAAQADAIPGAVAAVAPAEANLRTEVPDRAAPVPVPVPAVSDVEPADRPGSVVPAAPLPPTAATVAAPGASSPETAPSATRDPGDAAPQAQRQEAMDQQTAGTEAERLEAERQEVVRQAAAELDAQRQEAVRQEAARVAAARLEAERQEAARQTAARLEAQQRELADREAARVAAARLEAERLEVARQEASQRDAQRQEAARLEAARTEAARLDAERQAAARLEAQRQQLAGQEAARAEAERLEAERLQATRQAAAQLEVQRQEAARLEAARTELARLEAVRQAAATQEATRALVAQEAAAKREAVLRAIGRQLDEEAAQREAAASAARLPNTLPYSLSTARRVRLWGRADPNVELVQYAEAWSRKIQLNTAVDTVREVARRPHTPPMVTVAVRSDGSVESVTFVVSSGVAEIDAAIRRIVESQRPYAAFPPALVREFDVIEIRRTWYFDTAIRMH